jgi:DNA-directed RNA polymerase sigma subunit (sigma70/sigma32)
MSPADRESLEARTKAGSRDLTLDEVSILFLITREKIRAVEKTARGKQ